MTSSTTEHASSHGGSHCNEPLIPKEGGMVQVDIGGHPPIPFGPAPSILAAFHIQHNLLFLAGFRVLNFRSRFEALNDFFWINREQHGSMDQI